MKLSKCPICGKEYENGRQLHGHMLKAHQAEYKEAGNKVSNMIESKKKIDRPSGFRLLNKSVESEAEAYSEGYRYIDHEYYYTHDEAIEMGWI